MSSPRLIVALTADVRMNARALKQIRALHESGFHPVVVGLDRFPEMPVPPHIEWHPLTLPATGGPRFFLSWHRHLKQYLRRLPPADLYLAGDLYVLPAMRATARRHRAALIYDARERYPFVAGTAGKPLHQRFWFELERHYIRQADRVLTVSPGLQQALVEDYGIAPPLLLMNIPPHREPPVSRRLREHLNLPDDRPLFLHQGIMKSGRGCLRLVEAMRAVPEATLVFLGYGPEEGPVRQAVHDAGLHDRVHVLSPVPPDELLTWTASADVGITLLEDTCLNHRLALPNKLFEYLMAGLPVLAGALPEMNAFLRQFPVGMAVSPDDTQALAHALRSLARNPELRTAYRATIPRVWETFSWERQVQPFVDACLDLVNRA